MEAQFYYKRNTILYGSILFLSLSVSPLILKAAKLPTEPFTAFPAATVRDSVVKSATVNISPCNGGANGSATIGVKGGTAPYTYSWTPNVSSTATANGLTAGTYSVTVMDSYGNSGTTAVVTITQPAALRDSIATNTGVGCSGGSGGSSKVGAKGGTMPYTYLWSNGSTLATASGLSAGTYSVTVYDKNGCSNTASVTITQPNTISDNLGSLTNPSCNGQFGNATINISGGTSPYVFTWTHGVSTTASATNLLAGSYTVTIKDAHGCTGSSVTFTVTQPVAIRDSSVAASKQNVTCNGGNNGTIIMAAKYGKSPYTYTWAPNVSSGSIAHNLSAGTYSITVTDNNGCTSSVTTVTITQPGALRDSVSAQTNIGCNGGNGGSASIGVKYGKAPYTYSWSPNSDNTYTASNLTAGTYSVTITDNNGCSSSLTVTITQPGTIRDSLATIIYPACYGTNGTATVGVKYGIPPYTYLWTGGVSTTSSATNLVAGSYTVTVKDAHGCTSPITIAVTQPSALAIAISSHTNPLCNGGMGTVTANPATGGTAPYNYAWSPSGGNALTASGLPANTYTLTATDNNGCSVSNSVTISEPNAIRDSITGISNPPCSYQEGVVTLGVKYGTAPYTYLWSNGVSTAVSTYIPKCSLPGGAYSITINDAHGCMAYATAAITAPPLLSATASITTNVSCHGGNTGSVVALPAGGISPYQYQWSDINLTTTANVSSLPAGTYTVNITDNNGCAIIDSIVLTQTTLSTDLAVTNPLCNGGVGSANFGVTGGAAPYTYFWGPNLTTASYNATDLAAGGEYQVQATDANGCNTSVFDFTITQPEPLTDSISSVSCSSEILTASVGTSGGTSPYTYSWSPGGGTSQQMTGLTEGFYTITITDANGCSGTITQNLKCTMDVLHKDAGKTDNQGSEKPENISLYPSPTSGLLTISGLEQEQTIEMYDYTGRKINLQFTIDNSQLVVNIADQPAGIYLIRILDKNGNLVSRKKVVKTN